MSLSTTISVWPTDLSVLGELLGLSQDGKLQCHGMTQKKKQCKRFVSASNYTLLKTLLGQIAQKGSLEAARSLLGQVSRLVMCPRYHQDQSSGQLKTWENTLGVFAGPHGKLEEEDNKPTLVKLEENEANNDEVSLSSSIHSAKDEKKTPKESIKQEYKAKARSASFSKIPKSTSPKPALTRQPTQHEFESFNKKPLTPMAVNRAVKKLLLRPLTKAEMKKDGLIYAYVFPQNYHDPAPHVKIGYTNNLDRRMTDWKRNCHYTPKLLFEFPTDSYVKIERLVHASLRNKRVRETGCPGCGKKHNEWFDVRSLHVSLTVGLWSEWMRLVPYDDAGNLKEKWVKRLEHVDLSDSKCWEKFSSEHPTVIGGCQDDDEHGNGSESDEELISNYSDDSEYLSCYSDEFDDGSY